MTLEDKNSVILPSNNTIDLSKNQLPTDHEMQVFTLMAKQAVDSKLYKGVGDMPAVMTIILSARELSIPPMQALNGGLNIIQGKIEISARMMNALIRRAGHYFPKPLAVPPTGTAQIKR